MRRTCKQLPGARTHYQVAEFLVAATTGSGPPVSAALQLWRMYDVEEPPPAAPLRHPRVRASSRSPGLVSHPHPRRHLQMS